MPKITAPILKKRKLNELENQESLDSKSNIIEKKRKLTNQKEKPKLIALKFSRNGNWIWRGTPILEENNQEKPLTLEFDNKKYYFYSTGIKKEKSNWYSEIISFKNQINLWAKKEIIKKFDKVMDQNNLVHQELLLKLKNDTLDKQINFLNEEVIKEKNNLNAKDNTKSTMIKNLMINIKNLKKSFKEFNKDFKNFNKELVNFENGSQSIEATEFEYFLKKRDSLEEQIINFYNRIDNLNQLASDSEKQIDDLKKILPKDNQDLTKLKENEDDQDKLTNEKKAKNIKNKRILIKHEKNNYLIWSGKNIIDEQSKEEPLVLELDNQNYYFYSTGFNNISTKTNWIYFNNINNNNKEQFFQKFENLTNQENPYWKTMLIKLKTDTLYNQIRILEKNLNEEKKNLNDEDKESLNQSIINIKDETKKIYNKTKTTANLSKEYEKNFIASESSENLIKNIENLTQEIADCDEKINILSDKSIDLPQRIENLSQSFPQINKSLKENNQIKTILLKTKTINKRKRYTIWNGKATIDETEKEEPLVLKFNNKDFYFYTKNIEKNRKHWLKNWNCYNTKLNSQMKEKVIDGFSERIKQNNLSDQSILFLIKTDLINNIIKDLNEKVRQEKKFLESEDTKSWKSEINNLRKEIYFFNNQSKNLNKMIDFVNQPINENNTTTINYSNKIRSKEEAIKWVEIQNIQFKKLLQKSKNLSENIDILIKNKKSQTINLNNSNWEPEYAIAGPSGLTNKNFNHTEYENITNSLDSNQLVIDFELENNKSEELELD